MEVTRAGGNCLVDGRVQRVQAVCGSLTAQPSQVAGLLARARAAEMPGSFGAAVGFQHTGDSFWQLFAVRACARH